MIYIGNYSSSLGQITLAGNSDFLTGLWFDGQKFFGDTIPSEYTKTNDSSVFGLTVGWLDEYFAGRIPRFTPKLRLDSTPFRMAVWEILLTIPYGKTMTYGEIAAIIAEKEGKPKMSAQAVGGAVGHNPISLIVPCHRVVGAKGALTGYAGGIDIKTKLLELEKAEYRMQ